VEFRILGPLEVRRDSRALQLGGTKQRALLAVLLLHPNQVVSADKLIDDLWGEDPPATAENVLQAYISRLRKVLEPNEEGARGSILQTRKPGYILNVDKDELDLHRFETLADQARNAFDGGDANAASTLLREALVLWRGEALADFTFEAFAQADIERLRELRLAALEDRLEADVALGRGPELVVELLSLVAEHPLRERLRGHLMVALYRSGRQAEALEAYQHGRRVLVEELGIDPGADLQRLERAILNQDPSLSVAERPKAEPEGMGDGGALADSSILLAPRDPKRMEALLALAAPLARQSPPHDLMLVRLLGSWTLSADGSGGEVLVEATEDLDGKRQELRARGVSARVVAFTSDDPGEDLARMVQDYPVDQLLVDGTPELFERWDPANPLHQVLEHVQCDVAVLLLKNDEALTLGDAPVVAPFGGAEHDWAALQFGAWLAGAHRVPLQLLGTRADLTSGRRDASRLLGRASLMVQQVTGVVAQPVLVEPGGGIQEALKGAGVVVIGLSERWREEGLGTLRAEIVRAAHAPVLVLRRGPRPAEAGDREAFSRYTWSRAAGA
jgi:DNA-binding SARP family transcriptional activator